MAKTDLEIAQEAKMQPIDQVAAKVGIESDDLEYYGKYKAKLNLDLLQGNKEKEDGKLILVTAINPTKAGEGKSTTTVGLGDGLNRLGKKTIITLREPSLGPVFGLKGGAAGGGYAQVVPMEDLNLHFTGDMHAITTCNNLISACIDNHIHQGNELQIDPERITWKRCLDMNDRVLRQITVGQGPKSNGVERKDGFNITVASEVMAVLCLSTSLMDLKKRLSEMLVAYNMNGDPVYVKDLKIEGALALIMKDAIKPNLVQTLENNPAIVHGGPFANIAHGCNSIMATKLALKLADYVVTEAGFGADLGAEKFLDIVCPRLGKTPDAIVIVATVRALKMNGGVAKDNLNEENVEAVQKGYVNLQRHIRNMKRYGVPVVVAVNKFATDTDAELNQVIDLCKADDADAYISDGWAKGSKGVIDLAHAVVDACDQESDFKPLYQPEDSIEQKIETLVTKFYGGAKVEYSPKAKRQIKQFAKLGWDKMPVCMAKTQYSFSDNAKLLGAPTGFTVHIREFVPKLGAQFIVALTGNVLTMPGLPKVPAANGMHVDENGKVSGLY